MPATLKREGDELLLSLSGHPDFRSALEVAKRIPKRRWDGDRKVWVYPAEEATALRIMHALAPQPDAAVLEWVRGAATRVADELSAQLPSDAELYWEKGPKLFQFQRPAVDYLATVERVLLGDDMGLGKTIESIGGVQEWIARDRAKLERQQSPGLQIAPKLVIAGTSKLGDWVEELETWTGSKEIEAVPGDMTAPKRRAALERFERTAGRSGGWLVVNHEQLRAKKDDDSKKARHAEWQALQPWFGEQEWLAVLADEAHRFKNDQAQQSRGLWQVHARLRYALTGTPIINSPDELWSVLAWLRPDRYNENGGTAQTYWQFYYTYVESYAVPGRGRVITGVKNPEDLRVELTNIMVRRSKALLQRAGLLPDKLPTKTRHVKMGKKQAKLYHEAENSFWLTVEQDVAWLQDVAAGRGATGPAGEDAEQVTAEQAQATLERLGKNIADGASVAKMVRFLPNAGAKHSVLRQIATSPALVGGPDESAKLDAVIEDIEDAGEKQFVAFTWHRLAAELLVERLQRRKIAAEFMHGDTKQLERTEVVRRWTEGETQVLVSTIKTGGEGLNLVQTDMPLFVELSDRITDNDQAEDRTWRLGQKEDVQPVVYRTEGTVETERQDPRLRMKAIMLGATVGRDRER